MNEFLFHIKPTQKLKVFFENLKETLINKGSAFNPQSSSPKLVLNAITPEKPTSNRRRAQATFVVTAMECQAFLKILFVVFIII